MSANREDMIIYNAFFDNAHFWNSDHVYMEIGAHDGIRETNTRFYDVCLGWKGLLVEPHPANWEKLVNLRPSAHHLGMAPSCLENSTEGFVLFPKEAYTSAQANIDGNSLEVHCGPLSFYLNALEMKHIDFWSLDVEGSELDVLRTVDFARVQIDVIIVESDNRMRHQPGYKQKVENVRLFLKENGYLMLKTVYVPRSDVFLSKQVCPRYDFPECEA
jgi:FkbM family methyltransferase